MVQRGRSETNSTLFESRTLLVLYCLNPLARLLIRTLVYLAVPCEISRGCGADERVGDSLVSGGGEVQASKHATCTQRKATQ